MADASPQPSAGGARARHLPRPSGRREGHAGGAAGRAPGRPAHLDRRHAARRHRRRARRWASRRARSWRRAGSSPTTCWIEIISERLRRRTAANGYILDGFPRTLRQAEGFETHERAATSPPTCSCFNIEVPRDELLRRLSGRRWCPKCQATYHVYNNPPKNDALCDHDGAKLIQREDDKEVGGGAAPRRVRRAHRAPHRLLPRPRRASTASTATGRVDVGLRATLQRHRRSGEAARERPEVLGRAAEDAPGLHASWWTR